MRNLFQNFITFSGFGTCWYLILYMHDDPRHFGDPNWTPCITGMQNLTSAVLFSIETQQTIGYGYYHVTEECPLAGVLLFVQTVWGVILEGTVVGLVFIKMSRAKQRSETIMFSKNAVLTMRDGVMNFMFRIGGKRQFPKFITLLKIMLSFGKLNRLRSMLSELC